MPDTEAMEAVNGVKEVPITIEDAQEWVRTSDDLGLVGMAGPPRPFVHLFFTVLEYRHFPPDNRVLNDEFKLASIKWGDVVWMFVRVPASYRPQVEAVAAEMGLRLGDGLPTMLGGPDGPQRFPIDGDNVYTLENVGGSQVYQWTPQERDLALKDELARIQRIVDTKRVSPDDVKASLAPVDGRVGHASHPDTKRKPPPAAELLVRLRANPNERIRLGTIGQFEAEDLMVLAGALAPEFTVVFDKDQEIYAGKMPVRISMSPGARQLIARYPNREQAILHYVTAAFSAFDKDAVEAGGYVKALEDSPNDVRLMCVFTPGDGVLAEAEIISVEEFERTHGADQGQGS